MRKLILSWLVVLSCCAGHAALGAPQTGWWWNPAESGRGFFVESENGVTFIGAYLYDDDGHATWLVTGDANADPYNYTGQLYNKSGGQTLFGDYVAPGGANVVGTLSVHFTDDTHGTLTWPGGTVAIERQIFDTTVAAFQPFSGWWWNPDESGSGYSVEVQGKNLFIVGFMYDDAGRPVWYFSAGPMSSDNTYHGAVLQFANGQTMSGAYHPPGTPATIATLDVTFKADNEAEFTFTESVAAAQRKLQPQAGKSKSKTLKPQLPKKSFYLPPETFTGNVGQAVFGNFALPYLSGDRYAITTLETVWTHDPPDPKPDTSYYLISNGNMTVSSSERTKVIDPDSFTVTTCKQAGNIEGAKLGAGDVSTAILEVSVNRKYLLYVHVDDGARSVFETGECVLDDGSVVPLSSTTPSPALDLTFQGVVVDDRIAGKGTKTVTEGILFVETSYSWELKAFRP